MSDRIQVVIAVPVDNALPPDVQGVGLRRHAIELMQEVAKVDESTVRFKGARDDVGLDIGGDVGHISAWQLNLLGVLFQADGEAIPGICGPIVHGDRVTRHYSTVSVVRGRDEYPEGTT